MILRPHTGHPISRARIVLALLTIALSSSARPAAAQPLKELSGSPEMQVLGESNSSDERWFGKKPNLKKLFTTPAGPDLVQQWLGTITGRFRAGKTETEKSSDFFFTQRSYSAEEQTQLKVALLVPHPRVIPMLDYGLVRAFAALEPPLLKTKSVQEVEVRGRQCRLYEKENGECILLIRLPTRAIVTLTTSTCARAEQLLDLAGKLDLERLEQKLAS